MTGNVLSSMDMKKHERNNTYRKHSPENTHFYFIRAGNLARP